MNNNTTILVAEGHSILLKGLRNELINVDFIIFIRTY